MGVAATRTRRSVRARASLWRSPAESDAAPSADPVNPAPSRQLRIEMSEIEQRPFSEKVVWRNRGGTAVRPVVPSVLSNTGLVQARVMHTVFN